MVRSRDITDGASVAVYLLPLVDRGSVTGHVGSVLLALDRGAPWGRCKLLSGAANGPRSAAIGGAVGPSKWVYRLDVRGRMLTT